MKDTGLDVQALGFGYGMNPLFENFSLRVGTGLHWLRGANGSGKSTLLRLLCGALKLNSGYISLDDLSIDKNPVAYRKNVIFCGTEPPPLPWLKAGELVQFYVSLYQQVDCDARLKQHLAAFDLLDTFSQPLNELSLGQGRKLMLSIALAFSVRLILLDEPFNGLDEHSLTYFRDCLRECDRMKQQILIVASHIDPEMPIASTLVLGLIDGHQAFSAGEIAIAP